MGKPKGPRNRSTASISILYVAVALTPILAGADASHRRDDKSHTRSAEKACHDLVQGKIAWNYEGDTRWEERNVKRLCRGTSKGAEPPDCFRIVMHGGVDWGGGTRWEWENAVDLCEGTHDAARTVECFGRSIRAGSHWRSAIRACEVR